VFGAGCHQLVQRPTAAGATCLSGGGGVEARVGTVGMVCHGVPLNIPKSIGFSERLLEGQFLSIHPFWTDPCVENANLKTRSYGLCMFRSFCNYIQCNTSSTAQGGGGSFKNRKPIEELGCCESGMAERSH